jgi:hypothetical protein
VELPSPGTFFAIVAFWSLVSLYVFRHAERNGSKHPTAWGIGAFLLGGIVVPVYFIRHWRRRGRR